MSLMSVLVGGGGGAGLAWRHGAAKGLSLKGKRFKERTHTNILGTHFLFHSNTLMAGIVYSKQL